MLMILSIKKQRSNSKKSNDGTQKEGSSKYGVKSNKCPPQVKDLTAFEEDMIDLVQTIRFEKVKSNFQRELNEDLKTIKSSNKTLTPADKVSNMYKCGALHDFVPFVQFKKREKQPKRSINFSKVAGFSLQLY